MPRVASRFLVVAMATLLATGWLTARTQPTQAVSPDVVISEVYGGGGNTSAPYQSDFIELYNRGASTVDLSTWSVQYASSAGTTWARTNLTGSIAAGGYYLVQQATGTSCAGLPCGIPLPTADATGTTFMSGTSGKVALLNNQVTIGAVACPVTAGTAGLVDFVGY